MTFRTPCTKLMATASALLMLSACMSGDEREALAADPNYGAGYSDGCHTGGTRVQGFDKTVTRDKDLFKRSEAYRAGWKSGYSACGGEEFRDRDVFGFEDRIYESGSVGSTY